MMALPNLFFTPTTNNQTDIQTNRHTQTEKRQINKNIQNNGLTDKLTIENYN